MSLSFSKGNKPRCNFDKVTSFRCEKYSIVCRIFPACPLAENDLAPRRVLLQRYADQGATVSDCIWTVAPSFAARTDAVYVSAVLGRVGVVKCDHKGDDRPLLTLLEECVIVRVQNGRGCGVKATRLEHFTN